MELGRRAAVVGEEHDAKINKKNTQKKARPKGCIFLYLVGAVCCTRGGAGVYVCA